MRMLHYAQEPVFDPYVNDGDSRVIRGGSYVSPPGQLRAASSAFVSPKVWSNSVFRLVRSLPIANYLLWSVDPFPFLSRHLRGVINE